MGFTDLNIVEFGISDTNNTINVHVGNKWENWVVNVLVACNQLRSDIVGYVYCLPCSVRGRFHHRNAKLSHQISVFRQHKIR